MKEILAFDDALISLSKYLSYLSSAVVFLFYLCVVLKVNLVLWTEMFWIKVE